MRILVTGGAGYIGSHTVLVLLQSGYDVVVFDNLCNSSRKSIERVSSIVERQVNFVEGDIRNPEELGSVFSKYHIDAVIHFAGLKAVGESVQKPAEYYDVNVGGTAKLLLAMQKANVSRMVFSSSATVYGVEAPTPYVESLPRGSTSNPYATSKAMIEKMLEDQSIAHPDWSIALLRYFNPIGAHESGLIGEDPLGIPNNLMPFMAQVAVGRRDRLAVFGGDYPTPDGTCRRDYLHVMDLAEGHVKALESLYKSGCCAYNLGTGSPVSVLEMISAFESETGVKIPYKIAPRREGDLAEFWADPLKANQLLGWSAKRSLNQMMADTWRWQSQNPDGYN
ncbi:MAG: UDP-glucose 4-epimerase GalE [Oceanospirillaceae bacterium]|nr:UDP-glucose 4-epimerase GalE [Oceanospirillaceae bacterium]